MTPTEMHIDALMEKIEKLQAENARYREALENIADQKISGSLVYDASELMIELAREALKGQ